MEALGTGARQARQVLNIPAILYNMEGERFPL